MQSLPFGVTRASEKGSGEELKADFVDCVMPCRHGHSLPATFTSKGWGWEVLIGVLGTNYRDQGGCDCKLNENKVDGCHQGWILSGRPGRRRVGDTIYVHEERFEKNLTSQF